MPTRTEVLRHERVSRFTGCDGKPVSGNLWAAASVPVPGALTGGRARDVPAQHLWTHSWTPGSRGDRGMRAQPPDAAPGRMTWLMLKNGILKNSNPKDKQICLIPPYTVLFTSLFLIIRYCSCHFGGRTACRLSAQRQHGAPVRSGAPMETVPSGALHGKRYL